MESNKKNNKRANALANRLLLGAERLVFLAESLSQTDWETPVIGDGRTIGVVVHHVAYSYPIEIELAQLLASGKSITGVTQEAVDQMNANHARDFKNVKKTETIALLRLNSQAAADAIRNFTAIELETAATISLNSDAPLTTQFFIEDHALRHSYHHLAKINKTLKSDLSIL